MTYEGSADATATKIVNHGLTNRMRQLKVDA